MPRPAEDVPVRVDTRTWGEDGGEYSADRRYRWSFERELPGDGRTICWIGLNPGTGDSEGRYRPTLQRIVDRSCGLGMGRFRLVNLFAWRCTKPADLRRAHANGEDVVGERCDEAIRLAVRDASKVVAVWGGHGAFLNRAAQVRALLTDAHCLGVTAKGMPRHPLYVPAATPMSLFGGPSARG